MAYSGPPVGDDVRRRTYHLKPAISGNAYHVGALTGVRLWYIGESAVLTIVKARIGSQRRIFYVGHLRPQLFPTPQTPAIKPYPAQLH